jgi:hypothetical protein
LEINQEADHMAGLRDRTAAVLQLKKDFQSANTAGIAGKSPAAPRRSAQGSHGASWLRQPDPALLGKEQAHQWLLPCVFAALFVIGVVTAARGWEQIERAAVSAAWPYTRGVIVSSEVESYSSSEGVRWRPAVAYLYRVGKREVLGTHVSLVEPVSAFNEADARASAERYRLHGEVLVYYNPERVNESVLDQSAPPSAYLKINLGLALATASAALLIMSLRSNARPSRPLPTGEVPQSN